MPSLKCSLNCPHCYLSKQQRQSDEIMDISKLAETCHKIADYYQSKNVLQKTIICYWYGGEPTEMGIGYFTEAADTINSIFTESKGYQVKHTILTALINLKTEWFEVFRHYGQGQFQSSFDGLMRGKGYLKKWEKQARRAIDYDLELSTISVVNQELIKQGPTTVLDYLSDIGITETSWLPFMWNQQNDGDPYQKYAPSMHQYVDFMITLSEHYFQRQNKQENVPEIGQMRFILGQKNTSLLGNIAGKTLFLLPDGEFVLPDYRQGFQEFMQPFGNILQQSFETILHSPARRSYLRKQIMRNNNSDCLNCDHSDKCLMEFWKNNRQNDDCFGAKRYVEWLLKLNINTDKTWQHPMLY